MCKQTDSEALEALDIEQLTFVLRRVLEGFTFAEALLVLDEQHELWGDGDEIHSVCAPFRENGRYEMDEITITQTVNVAGTVRRGDN